MDGERKRDPSIERALRREGAAWRIEAPPSGSTCVDAETLALWAESALPTIETLAVEMHVADCARCQEVVATFALSEPAPIAQPAATPWLQRWWLPLASGLVVATLLIVAVVRRNDAVPSLPETQTAKVEAPAASAASQAEPKLAPAPPAVIQHQPPASAPQQKRAAAAKAITPPEPANLTAAAPMTVAAPPPPPAAIAPPPPAPAPQQSSLTARAPAGVAGGMAGGVVAGTVTGVANTARGGATEVRAELAMPAASGASTLPAVIEFASPVAIPAGGRGGGGRGVAALSILRPDPVMRWRLVRASTKLERSTDDGATWVTVDLGGDPVAITGGGAPSPLTCWLVGRAGVVFRSIDAITFTRVAFPEPLDLVAITASDPLHATVTAAGGRRFTTDDGGTTWREIRIQGD